MYQDRGSVRTAQYIPAHGLNRRAYNYTPHGSTTGILCQAPAYVPTHVIPTKFNGHLQGQSLYYMRQRNPHDNTVPQSMQHFLGVRHQLRPHR